MKKLVMICAFVALGATSAAALDPRISIGPGGIGVDVNRDRDRDRDRRWRERDVVTTGSTRRCRTIIEESTNTYGERVERRTRRCD
jgi:hypothetical protein